MSFRIPHHLWFFLTKDTKKFDRVCVEWALYLGIIHICRLEPDQADSGFDQISSFGSHLYLDEPSSLQLPTGRDWTGLAGLTVNIEAASPAQVRAFYSVKAGVGGDL